MLFKQKPKYDCFDTESGLTMSAEVFEYIHKLRREINDLKFDISKLNSELNCLKPVLADAKIAPPVSKECTNCIYSVRSRWDGHVIGCRKESVCDDFKPKEE